MVQVHLFMHSKLMTQFKDNEEKVQQCTENRLVIYLGFCSNGKRKE